MEVNPPSHTFKELPSSTNSSADANTPKTLFYQPSFVSVKAEGIQKIRVYDQKDIERIEASIRADEDVTKEKIEAARKRLYLEFSL